MRIIYKVGITLTSSMHVGDEYIELTNSVAKRFAEEGFGIVYGGTEYGMMSELAKKYKENGGTHLTGIMAKDLMKVTKGYKAFEGLDDSYLEETMENRKGKIVSLSDGFLILPGGYGTFQEIGSIMGGKTDKIYDKPIVVYNFNGYYDTLLKFFEELYEKKFSKISPNELLFVSSDLDEIVAYYKNYQKKELSDKFVD